MMVMYLKAEVMRMREIQQDKVIVLTVMDSMMEEVVIFCMGTGGPSGLQGTVPSAHLNDRNLKVKVKVIVQGNVASCRRCC